MVDIGQPLQLMLNSDAIQRMPSILWIQIFTQRIAHRKQDIRLEQKIFYIGQRPLEFLETICCVRAFGYMFGCNCVGSHPNGWSICKKASLWRMHEPTSPQAHNGYLNCPCSQPFVHQSPLPFTNLRVWVTSHSGPTRTM